MTESTPLEALEIFENYFKDNSYLYQADTDKRALNTVFQFGFYGSHSVHIVAHEDALGVGIQILERVPNDLEATIELFARETDGRVTLSPSGALMWGGPYDPDTFESVADVEDLFLIMSFEMCVVEGYLERFHRDGALPCSKVVFGGYGRDFNFGLA